MEILNRNILILLSQLGSFAYKKSQTRAKKHIKVTYRQLDAIERLVKRKKGNISASKI